MTSSVPSTGKRSEGANRVFGEAVFTESDVSLCYTPSPGRAGAKSVVNSMSGIRRQEEQCEPESPEPIALFQTSEPMPAFAEHLSSGKENNNCNGSDAIAKTKAAAIHSIRKNELDRLRATKKSPVRRTLVKITEAAIDNATNSLSASLLTRHDDMSRKKALSVTREPTGIFLEKSKAAKSVHFQWEQEKSQTISLRKKIDESRRSIRAIQRQLLSAHFKNKAQKQEASKLQRYFELEKAYKFNSEVFRDHQQTLKQERDKSRKLSMDTRAKMRRNNRAGEEKLKMMKQRDEQAMLEVRADLHRARMEAVRTNAETRRRSFQFRAGDARKIQELRLNWRVTQLEEEHRSYELTRAAAKDVQSYKKKVDKEKRDDIKSRNLDARRLRKLEQENACHALCVEHENFELKWAGERDAEAYQKRLLDERRKSLADRNKESARHAIVMEELRGLAKEQEAESFILKWAGEDDAKAYLVKLAEDRRKSLQLRAMESRKQRQYEEEEHAKAIQKALEEGAVQSACQQDLLSYKAECDERRRKSFQFRGKQARVQRLEEEQRRIEKVRKDKEAFNLDSLARKDVEEYYKDCQRRRRKSLAMRAKQMRQHFEWKKRRAESEVEERAHTSQLQSLDMHHMAFAREKERARLAMDALRSAGCTLKGNPFDDILNGV